MNNRKRKKAIRMANRQRSEAELARVQRVQELRRSAAASPRRTGVPRSAARRRAIKEQHD